VLVVSNLHCYYGRIHALKGISLHVKPEEIVALIGGNGAGKSTALKAISGIVRAASGTVTFNNNDITHVSPDKIVMAGISHVPEGRRIFPRLTVEDNLLLGAFTRRDSSEIKKDMEKMKGLFPVLANRSKQYAGTLSGGEQQMLAIARGLMSRPSLLLLDEPTMGLAPVIAQDIYRQVIYLNKEQGLAILIVEQNARIALGLAERGYIIETGRIVLEGNCRELKQSNEIKRAYLGKDYREVWE